ncbi:MAG: 3-deoxy-8-phosphooctulonate synthase [Thermodesulfovibrionales bacterium]|nr:3-deoxy-8-phosphooctulonate synthase [Thermodesulfovibrionales bacterium]
MKVVNLDKMQMRDLLGGGKSSPLIIAGPCVIESESMTLEIAYAIKEICSRVGVPLIFKSSYDKANRTSIKSYRGPGLEKGLRILADVKKRVGVPVLSDVHSVNEVKAASEVLDILQIPAFLCRQTDIILASANTGRPVNVKKGQFLAPWDVQNIIEKFTSTGNQNIMITERGTTFGYNNLVVDFRSFPIIRSFGVPVIFDVTHSLQLPGGQGSCSGGQREFAEPLARAAIAAGIDGLFMEVHHEPDKALCDGPNMIRLNELESLLRKIKAIYDLVRGFCNQ